MQATVLYVLDIVCCYVLIYLKASARQGLSRCSRVKQNTKYHKGFWRFGICEYLDTKLEDARYCAISKFYKFSAPGLYMGVCAARNLQCNMPAHIVSRVP